jgi:hypothetical protein
MDVSSSRRRAPRLRSDDNRDPSDIATLNWVPHWVGVIGPSRVGCCRLDSNDSALTPGERNLGGAVLFMFWLPVLFLAVAGVCFLFGSAVVFVYRKWKNTEHTAAPNC